MQCNYSSFISRNQRTEKKMSGARMADGGRGFTDRCAVTICLLCKRKILHNTRNIMFRELFFNKASTTYTRLRFQLFFSQFLNSVHIEKRCGSCEMKGSL